MLSKEDNEIISHVGPGTLLGNLLRRYWTPALLSKELPEPDCAPVKVRMLCEDLVAFRDTNGQVGLVDINCPHRGASMFFGRNEEAGLRCVYHGWKFDADGNCTDMPSEPATSIFKDKLKIISYPTHESGGIIWTYMGPKEKMTGFRDFGTEGLPKAEWRANKHLQPMTFMQALEGSYDTTHTSWLHMWGGAANLDANADGSDEPGAYNSSTALWKFWWADKSPDVETVDAWHGFRGAGLRKTPNGNTHLRLYHFIMPYGHFNVPIDDNAVHSFSFNTIHSEKQKDLVVAGKGNEGLRIKGSPYEELGYKQYESHLERNLANDYLIDRQLQKDGTIYSGIGPGDFNWQDIMARQTAFLDRTKEHLGSLDTKIIKLRRLLIDAAKKLDRGIDPPAIDPSLPYDKIDWPDKVLLPGEDWRTVGTEVDPDYRKLHGLAPLAAEAPAISV